ncbi:MAG TPA: DegT/DnrJ/EryC1/StrS family aminotransferase [Vicinamibacterales bacterium]|nr:DegT/DnrJ/EryC1/StrS family aminotransferase [Vicinamibacterales bacterium]
MTVKVHSKIPITKPFFGAEEAAAVTRPLETGWVVQGPFVQQFEDTFAAFTGADHAVATSSCTTALHLVVEALGTSPGDEVLVPAFTWVATPNVVEYVGARPVFCDVDLDTFNVNTEALKAAITPRTVGIIPVHLFGLCADIDAVQRIARQHHLWIAEDAACAFGARWRGYHAGTFGAAGCFSFHPRKAITTGEGGMMTTNRRELVELVRTLRDHGASRSDRARHDRSGSFLLPEYPLRGYNYRMTDIQAALGCAQMQRAAWIQAERARVARAYDELLADVAWLRLPKAPADFVHGYQSYVCLFAPERPTLSNVQRMHAARNRLMATLEEQGIATRQGTHAPVFTEYYVQKYDFRPEQFPQAYLAERLSLSLPLYPQMTTEDIERVAIELREAFDR